MYKLIRADGWSSQMPTLNELLDPYKLKHGLMEKIANQGVHPSVWQYIKDYVKADPRYQFVLASNMGAFETWGCFPPGTRILMGDGKTCPIEEVQVGDEVITHTGKIKAVRETFTRANEDALLSIKASGSGNVLRCTPNHPVLILKQEEVKELRVSLVNRRDRDVVSYKKAIKELGEEVKPTWCAASDIKLGDYLLEPIIAGGGNKDQKWVDKVVASSEGHPGRLLRQEFDMDESKALATILGYYTAEGCLLRQKNNKGGYYPSGVLLVCEKDSHEERHLLDACTLLGLTPYLSDDKVSKKAIRVQLSSSILASLCENLIGHQAAHKFIHLDLLHQPLWWKEAFLGAYFDGDGNQSQSGKDRGTIKCSTASKELAEGIVRLLASMGIPATWCTCTQHETTWGSGNPIYSVSIGSWYAEKLATHVSRFFVPDKDAWSTTNTLLLPHFLARPVRSIAVEESSSCPIVYNLAIDSFAAESSYLSEGWSVHNSNVNADSFTRDVLGYQGTDWGINTFKTAGIYKHHQNKDRSKSYGDIVFVVFASAADGYLDRVESVIRIDREKAARVGAEDVCNRIDRGEYPHWSMGCYKPGATVVLEDGTKRAIEDIAVGSKVLTHCGRARPVTQLHKRPFSGTLYRLSVDRHPDLFITGEHPLYVVRKETVGETRELEWICADHLEIGDRVMSPISIEDARTKPEIFAGTGGTFYFHKLGPYMYCGYTVLGKESQQYDGLVYNLEVDEDASYLVEGLSSHNCRVPYDVCSLCGNRAKTRENYCQCMKQYPNQIITADFFDKPGFEKLTEDKLGLRICVFNPKPVFFDFSQVYIGAAPEAKTLKKVASAPFNLSTTLWDRMLKESGTKISEKKEAEIEKRIEGEDTGRTIKVLNGNEPPIPEPILDMLGKVPGGFDLPTSMGMILSPGEFTRSILGGMGMGHIMDGVHLPSFGLPPSDMMSPFPPSQCHLTKMRDGLISTIGHALLSLVEDRSFLGPIVKRRVIISIGRKLPELPPPVETGTDTAKTEMKKISSLYNSYRFRVLDKLAGMNWIHPEVQRRLGVEQLENALAGLSKQAEPVISPLAIEYALYAYGFNPQPLLKHAAAAQIYSRISFLTNRGC